MALNDMAADMAGGLALCKPTQRCRPTQPAELLLKPIGSLRVQLSGRATGDETLNHLTPQYLNDNCSAMVCGRSDITDWVPIIGVGKEKVTRSEPALTSDADWGELP